MRKKIILLLVICILFGAGHFLMSQAFQFPELVNTPTFKEVGGFWYAYMDLTTIAPNFQESVNAFAVETKKQGIKSDWLFEIFYSWSDKDGDEIKWAMAYIVPGDTKVAPPLKLAKLEKLKTLMCSHTGSLERAEVKKTNNLVEKYIKDNGYKQRWPVYEIICKNPPRIDIMYLVEE